MALRKTWRRDETANMFFSFGMMKPVFAATPTFGADC
jgi:hypothetical protein